MSDLTVWSGSVGFNRSLVATKTKKRAIELLGVSLYEFNLYWGKTGNKNDIALALTHPETLLVSSNSRFGEPWYVGINASDRPYDKGAEPLMSPSGPQQTGRLK